MHKFATDYHDCPFSAKLIDITSFTLQAATTQASLSENVSQAQADIESITNLLQHFSREGDDIYITGANLHVVNGMEETDTSNRLGNIIIGYNESRPGGDQRDGSHMLIVGSRNNYSGYGGIVAGFTNSVAGAYASVSGGRLNSVEADYASISGGWVARLKVNMLLSRGALKTRLSVYIHQSQVVSAILRTA